MKQNTTKYYCDRCGAEMDGQMFKDNIRGYWYLKKKFDSESALDSYLIESMSEDIDKHITRDKENDVFAVQIDFEKRYAKSAKHFDLCKNCTLEFERFIQNEI